MFELGILLGLGFLMVARSILRDVDMKVSLKPIARTATANGTSVNLAGFNAATCYIMVGTITDGTHTPKLQDSPDDSTWTDVAAADLIGSFAALATDTDQEVGYRGGKKWVRAVSTVSGATTGGVYAMYIQRGLPTSAPV